MFFLPPPFLFLLTQFISDSKKFACNPGDPGLIPGSGRSLGDGNGYPLRILSCRIPWTEKPGGLQSTGVTKSQTWLSDLALAYISLAVLGLRCSMWDLVPWPGIEPLPSALGEWSLSHWTTREVPKLTFQYMSLITSLQVPGGVPLPHGNSYVRAWDDPPVLPKPELTS